MVTDQAIWKALEKVLDPELDLSVVDLGLIYRLEHRNQQVEIDMTLTSLACPFGPQMVKQVETVVSRLEGVGDVTVKLVYQPPWTPDKMSDRLKKAREMGLVP